MRVFRKTAVFAAVCILAGALLTGCHGSKGRAEFAVPEQLDESRKIELTFWAKNDTNKTQTKIYEKAISDFESLYPNINVNMRLYTDYGKIYNDVITNISTNTTPNVCITYPDHIATYMTGDNVVVPLDSLIGDAKYGLAGSELKFDGPSKDEVVPQFLSECSIGGTTYALPYMRSTEACYVNKTFVEKLGYDLGLCLGSVRGGHGQRRGRKFRGQRTESYDPFHRQVHRQYDDPDAQGERRRLFHR